MTIMASGRSSAPGRVRRLSASVGLVRAKTDRSCPGSGTVVVLGAVGTGLASVWNSAIVDRRGATAASTVTYLTPLVGVVLGVVVSGENASWNQPVGAAVVVAGVVIAQRRGRRGP